MHNCTPPVIRSFVLSEQLSANCACRRGCIDAPLHRTRAPPSRPSWPSRPVSGTLYYDHFNYSSQAKAAGQRSEARVPVQSIIRAEWDLTSFPVNFGSIIQAAHTLQGPIWINATWRVVVGDRCQYLNRSSRGYYKSQTRVKCIAPSCASNSIHAWTA